MKLSKLLDENVSRLIASDISTARLDVLVLLEDCTGKDRSWLLAHPEYELTNQQLAVINDHMERRTKHEPLAYIRGKTEFYGREFIVNKRTLEPRPETETMIELLKSLDTAPFEVVVDVGTGSGAIAITAKLELPKLKVYGTDIDNKCTQTAEANAKKHNVSIDFRQGNLLEPLLDEKLSDWAVIANLPYVPDSHTINQAAMFEPKHAIFGGSDGLNYYLQMFEQIDRFKTKPIYIFTESLPFQHEELAKIAQTSGYKQQRDNDFIQVFSIN